jgi:hypothetical protein
VMLDEWGRRWESLARTHVPCLQTPIRAIRKQSFASISSENCEKYEEAFVTQKRFESEVEFKVRVPEISIVGYISIIRAKSKMSPNPESMFSDSLCCQ